MVEGGSIVFKSWLCSLPCDPELASLSLFLLMEMLGGSTRKHRALYRPQQES